MGCEVNILRIVENIKGKFERKIHRGVWCLFVDLKSAFDMVDHGILFEKMRKLEIKEDLIQTIE